MNNLESPDISRCLKTGFPRPPKFVPLCADCGEDMGEWAYEVDRNTFVCEECFKDRMHELISMDPGTAARKMDISREYLA